jgi:hypothetical protein
MPAGRTGAEAAEKACARPIGRYRGAVVHLSVAIGQFFEALLIAMFSVAFWAMLEVIGGAAALVGVIMLARRLLKHGRRRR